jgi:energy-converting hydrogenase A subunit D
MPFIIAGGYTDVAIAVSLIAPVTTIFILMVCRSDADDSA